ncbi:tRNA dihydrouridine synthase DusB [Thalassolituus sp.]|jgi:tRNA-dihydrouridine synthase B|uniref:tRNA dihydrouridine synthase DusB n=1 Tax=Thalassolituus sp. TaxID=2030822 RepID=UPI002EA9D38F|nr:tRNA dihydrouridine synthase DusB [Pseudomonadota bacterium]MEC8443558.1 tRNA dihydrouridine synthase DusB [Pseudomonadota bacterium]MEC8522644.1 tRNA dihydrouridine synthase DusB [Pseudomonadota bacterium]
MPSIGPYTLPNPVVLAPMAGVTDRPFRQLCRELGAGLVVGEMVSGKPELRNTRKSKLRLDHTGEPEPIAVQIVGGDPEIMADSARFNVENGAQIIDINMGCPAKKVCNKAAGSALLRDEALVKDILQATVEAVNVPVSLKIRTGWCPDSRNAVRIAELAEQAGIVSLAVHGRTRACGYGNTVEYDTIRDVKQSTSLPVFANGDITDARKAVDVMRYTGADGVLIGRAAQGRPWIFREVVHFMETDTELDAPGLNEIESILQRHLNALYEFYGEYLGVRIARKHVSWYLNNQPGNSFRKTFNQLDSPTAQMDAISEYFRKASLRKEAAA